MAFLSDRLDAKNKTGTRIWVMPLNGGEAKPLTDPNFEIIDFKWNAEGSHIYYLAYTQKAKRTRDWDEKRQKVGFDALDVSVYLRFWELHIVWSSFQRDG